MFEIKIRSCNRKRENVVNCVLSFFGQTYVEKENSEIMSSRDVTDDIIIYYNIRQRSEKRRMENKQQC